MSFVKQYFDFVCSGGAFAWAIVASFEPTLAGLVDPRAALTFAGAAFTRGVLALKAE